MLEGAEVKVTGRESQRGRGSKEAEKLRRYHMGKRKGRLETRGRGKGRERTRGRGTRGSRGGGRGRGSSLRVLLPFQVVLGEIEPIVWNSGPQVTELWVGRVWVHPGDRHDVLGVRGVLLGATWRKSGGDEVGKSMKQGRDGYGTSPFGKSSRLLLVTWRTTVLPGPGRSKPIGQAESHERRARQEVRRGDRKGN